MLKKELSGEYDGEPSAAVKDGRRVLLRAPLNLMKL